MFVGVPLPPAAAHVTPTVPATPPRRRAGVSRRPMPSRAVLAIGALSLACVTLLAALVLTAAAPGVPTDGAASTMPSPDEATPDAPPAAAVADAASLADAAPTSGVDAQPIPPEMLASLEAASDAPLPTELQLFLRAAAHGFGDQSAQLEPTLRSYAYRLSSRFEWNPDTYAIAVSAPTLALAQERAALLGQLFSAAVASGRLTIQPSAGPHALSLVTE